MLKVRVVNVCLVFQRYVASVLYWCCKNRSRCCICCNNYTCMFRLFHLFQMYVASVSSVRYKIRFVCCIYMHGCNRMFLSVFGCFKRMFYLFRLDVAYILQWIHMCFFYVLDVCCKCFVNIHLDVSKVNLVLHILQ
jgi:hypothetical protein